LETPIPIISVEGEPFSRGETYGNEARALIRHNIDYYYGLWKRNLGLSREMINEKASSLVEPIKTFDSRLLEEMRGIARGADASLEEIIAINSRYELVWSQMGRQPSECTAIAALPEATSSGHTLLAQNWDYIVGVRDSCVILEVREEGKPTIVMHTEAGIIGQKGINSEGMGLVVNAMVADRDRFEPTVPFWILCRRALSSGTLTEAMNIMLRTRKAVSSNVILAQAGGVAVDLESTPLDTSIITPERGILVHSNHFIGPRSTSVKDEFVKRFSHSVYRYSRAKSKLEMGNGHISVERIMEVLRDHFGKPYSICAHADPAIAEDFRGETLSSVIFDLEDRRIHVTKGPPCESEYHELEFPYLKNENREGSSY